MRQMMKFGLVGMAAAGTHLGSLFVFKDGCGLAPQTANILAFLVAVQVSFLGHHHWTFATHGHGGKLARIYLKFFAVACAGFLLNAALYALFLKIPRLHYLLAQAIVQVIVAGMSFLLSKFWAFRKSPKADA